MGSRGQKGVLKGNKISNRHSTYIPDVVRIIEVAKASSLVTKITLGQIARIKTGKKRIKFCVIPVGLRVTIRGGISQQLLFIHTKDAVKIQSLLQETWNNSKKMKPSKQNFAGFFY